MSPVSRSAIRTSSIVWLLASSSVVGDVLDENLLFYEGCTPDAAQCMDDVNNKDIINVGKSHVPDTGNCSGDPSYF